MRLARSSRNAGVQAVSALLAFVATMTPANAGTGPVPPPTVTATAPQVQAAAAQMDVPGPLAMVQITSPLTGTMLHGATVVTVTGRVDPAGTDRPWMLYLRLQRPHQPQHFDDADCAHRDISPDPAVCTVTFLLPVSGLAGRFTLTGQMQTGEDHWLISAPVEATVFSKTRTTLYDPHVVLASGTVFRVQGGVGARAEGYPTTGGMKVHLVYRPSVGPSRTLAVRTDARGEFVVAFRLTTSGTITASTTGNTLYGPSTRTLKIHVSARIVCALGPTVRPGVIDHGRCSVAHLPVGTAVALQYQTETWHNLVRAPAPSGGVLRFAIRWSRSGSVALRLVTGANKAFVQTVGPEMLVHITTS